MRIYLALGVAILALSTGWYISHLRSENARLKTELTTANDNIAAMKANDELERNASHEYQDQIRNLNIKLSKLKRVRTYCVPVSPPAPGSGEPAARAVISGGGGISSGYLLDLGARCDADRLRLIGCQKVCK